MRMAPQKLMLYHDAIKLAINHNTDIHIIISHIIFVYLYNFMHMCKHIFILYVYCMYILYIYIWVNYNDLTATSLESWLVREIIPKWP